MRNTNIKNNKKFLGIIILCILALVAGVLALNFGGTSLYAHAAEIECCDNSEYEHSTQATFLDLNGNVVLEQKYLSAHYADGTMGMILDETYDSDEVIFEPFSYTHLQRSTVISSGKPDVKA